MNNLTTPRKITKEQIATIVEDGRALKELDVDWWTLSFDGFETIVKRCSNLEVLKVMLDAPIQKLVSETPGFTDGPAHFVRPGHLYFLR